MPTPDRRSGPLEEEQIIMDDRSGEGLPADERTIIYEDGAFRFVDAIGAYDPRTTSVSDFNTIIFDTAGGIVYDTAEDIVVVTP